MKIQSLFNILCLQVYMFSFTLFCHGKYKCYIWNDKFILMHTLFKQKCVWVLFKVNQNQIPNTGLPNEMNKRDVLRSIYF